MLFAVKRAYDGWLSAVNWIAGCRICFRVHDMPAADMRVAAISRPLRLRNAVEQHFLKLT